MELWMKMSQAFETMPLAAQIFVGLVLFSFAAASLYSRINLKFGAKVFPDYPPEKLRTDKIHIIAYTGIPVLLALLFFGLMLTYHLA